MEVGQCFVCVYIISAWMVIGMIGAFLFILIQLVLIVDFAHAWNEKWIGKYEDTQSKAWLAGKAAFYPCNAMLVWVLLAMTCLSITSWCSVKTAGWIELKKCCTHTLDIARLQHFWSASCHQLFILWHWHSMFGYWVFLWLAWRPGGCYQTTCEIRHVPLTVFTRTHTHTPV